MSRYCDALPLGVLVLDGERQIRLWNQWLVESTGVAADDALGRRLDQLFPGLYNRRFNSAVQQVIRGGGPQILSQALHHYLIPIEQPHLARHGLGLMRQHIHIEPCELGGEILAVVSVIDVTGSVLRTEAITSVAQRLEEDVNRDPLTGLFNRRFMWEWLEHQLKQAQRYEYGIALLMIDLDWFKEVNDSLGHQQGDAVLRAFAHCLDLCVRESDVVVRYGGDEFIVLLPRCDPDIACEVANRILLLTRETSLAGVEAGRLTTSIGMAYCDYRNLLASGDLLREADRSLYVAKGRGRNQVACEV